MRKQLEFKIPNSKNESKYIGFNENDFSVFCFPPQYLEEEYDCNKKLEAKKIITLIKRYRKEFFMNGSNSELDQLQSMIWLMLDYINRGYYVESEKLTKVSNNGAVDWKKSIKLNSTFLDKKVVIYRDFVRKKVNYDDTKMITEVYKACLKYSIERLGFLFNLADSDYSIYDIEKDKEQLLYFLRKESYKTFNDYKKLLIENLISIISNLTTKTKNNGFSIYEKEFEYVFEYLLNNVFGTDNISKYYNQYIYKIGNEKREPSKLRPDLILISKGSKTCYILDAKFYNYGYSKELTDLPNSSDISKQISYNRYLRDSLKTVDELNKYRDFKVISAFILPTSFKGNEKRTFIKDIGIAQSKVSKDKNDFVHVILVDLKMLIDKYFDNSSVSFNPYSEIVNAIKKYEEMYN